VGKKVLAISASPRRHGNSDTLCDAFLRGAAEAGSETEKIVLREQKISFCTGCEFCMDHGRCVLHDDAPAVIAKMLEADVIVMATPVYFYCMCGQLKTLIDRCCPSYRMLGGKDYYLLMTAEETGADTFDETVACFGAFLRCLPDARLIGVLKAGGVFHKGEIEGTDYPMQAYELGKHA